MNKVEWIENDLDSFKRAVILALCATEGKFEKLPDTITENPLYAQLNQNRLRADLGQLIGKINSNLGNGNQK